MLILTKSTVPTPPTCPLAHYPKFTFGFSKFPHFRMQAWIKVPKHLHSPPRLFLHHALEERSFVSRRASQLFTSSACLSTRSLQSSLLCHSWRTVDILGNLTWADTGNNLIIKWVQLSRNTKSQWEMRPNWSALQRGENGWRTKRWWGGGGGDGWYERGIGRPVLEVCADVFAGSDRTTPLYETFSNPYYRTITYTFNDKFTDINSDGFR